MPADGPAFDRRIPAWESYLATPWARVRYDVVATVLDRLIAELGPGPLRILDLGGGDGADSIRLAEAGHRVTIVDGAAGMLARAHNAAESRGCADRLRAVESDLLSWQRDAVYDLVLCHFVLPYLAAADQDRAWSVVQGALAPNGIASVVSPNPVAEVLSAIHRDDDVSLALRRLRGDPLRGPTFDHDLHSRPLHEVERSAAEVGLEVRRRVGLRVAVDLLPDGPAKHDPDRYRDILELELALAEQRPYLDIARAWQLVLAHRPDR